jgi:hypothetical protein
MVEDFEPFFSGCLCLHIVEGLNVLRAENMAKGLVEMKVNE